MARPLLQSLSDAHRRIALAVKKCEEAGSPAFLPELARTLGMKSQSGLTRTLSIMERNGYVKIHGAEEEGRRRTRVAELTPGCRRELGFFTGLPVLGSIPAGLLSGVEPLAEETLDPAGLLPWKPGDFLLRVSGDSMTGAGILDGDLVLLRPNEEPKNGQIAAVCAGGERMATLKRVFFEGAGKARRLRLKAENPLFKDVVVPAGLEVVFAGVLKGVIRSGDGMFRGGS